MPGRGLHRSPQVPGRRIDAGVLLKPGPSERFMVVDPRRIGRLASPGRGLADDNMGRKFVIAEYALPLRGRAKD